MTKNSQVATLPIEIGDINAAASTTLSGVSRLATVAETKAGSSAVLAVTPAGLQADLLNCKVITALGKNGSGAVTLSGAIAGDKVLAASGITAGTLGALKSEFETTITVNGQIQQVSSSNYSAVAFLFILLPVA